MPIIVTENWSAFRFQRGKSGHRQFLVSGAATQAEAENATGIPRESDSMSQDARLKASKPQISTPQGPTLYTIDTDYAATSFSGSAANLALPPKYRPIFSKLTAGVDRDKHGNPIVNSARDAFDQPTQREFTNIGGAPINPEYRVGDANTPGTNLLGPPEGSDNEVFDIACYLRYEIYESIPFAGLGLTP